MQLFQKNIKFYITFPLIVFSILSAQSNDLKSITEQAVGEYEKGQYMDAIKNMQKALDIMKEKQGNAYNKILPQTLPGWTRGEKSSKPMDPLGLEEGLLIQQTYNKGNGYITTAIMVNSPMVEDVKRMLNNAQISGSREGYTFETIANKKALVRYYEDRNKGEITILANNTSVAAVYGENVSLREMKNYARLIKFNELNKIK